MHGMPVCLFMSDNFHSWSGRCALCSFMSGSYQSRARVSWPLTQCSFICSALISVCSDLQEAPAMREESQIVSFAVGGHCAPAFIYPSSLFWQVNRIEETTSVIPSMLTTVYWIQRPTSAGRSLLLTHSGTIGTASTYFKTKLLPNSYQKPMEIGKLICFACHRIHLYKADILK